MHKSHIGKILKEK